MDEFGINYYSIQRGSYEYDCIITMIMYVIDDYNNYGIIYMENALENVHQAIIDTYTFWKNIKPFKCDTNYKKHHKSCVGFNPIFDALYGLSFGELSNDIKHQVEFITKFIISFIS